MELPIVRELLNANTSLRFVARKVVGGYSLCILTPTEERYLSAQRGHPRIFKKLDTIASTLEELGVTEFQVVVQA